MPRTISSLRSTVDELGRIKAQIADLKATEEQLRQTLLDAGIESTEGKLFRATVSRYDQTCVDYAGLIEQLAPPARLIKKFTTTSERTTVRVVARKAG